MSWLYAELSSLLAAVIVLGAVLALVVLAGLGLGWKMGRGR